MPKMRATQYSSASGIRVSELCGLSWRDLQANGNGGQVTVFGKGGKTRTILLKPKVWQQLLSVKGGAGAADSILAITEPTPQSSQTMSFR